MTIKQTEYVVIQPTNPILKLWNTLLGFGGFAALLWFNHAYLSGNGWLDFAFVVIWLLALGQTNSSNYHKFTKIDDAIKCLEDMKNAK